MGTRMRIFLQMAVFLGFIYNCLDFYQNFVDIFLICIKCNKLKSTSSMYIDLLKKRLFKRFMILTINLIEWHRHAVCRRGKDHLPNKKYRAVSYLSISASRLNNEIVGIILFSIVDNQLYADIRPS